MLVHPQFDPVAFSLGPLSVRWYGLMYLAGFLVFLWLAPRHARRLGDGHWTRERLDALLFYGVLGVVLGGRLGEVLFYQPQYYFAHPLEILAIWHGGMSFHGGLIGVILALWLFARREGMGFWQAADFVAPLVPPGLGFGRLGNFINGELWGRSAPESLPWAMVYPQVDALPRHPSQLYEAFGEGVLLFVLLWWYAGRPRPTGRVSAVFLMAYGAIRFVCECFRTPDPGILSWLTPALSTAQWLSLAMLLAGALLYLRSRQSPAPSFPSTQG